jgi:allantoin racemase
MMIGLIRVFTTEVAEIVEQHGQKITELYGVPVQSQCIPDQPLGIYDESTEEMAIPKIVELGLDMEKDGCRLLVISCAADPAIEQLRKQVSVPVIGAGSAASLMALSLGQPVGIMGITEEVPFVMKKLLGELIVQYSRPEGVTNTTDLLTKDGQSKALAAAQFLLNQGAQTLVFACTGFSTIGLADVLRKQLQVPIIDAVEAEGMFASAMYKQLVV